MTAVWPSSIVIHQLFPVSIAPVEARAVFQPEHGEPKRARTATEQCYRVQFDVLVSGINLRTDFLSWWEDQLQHGSQPFTGLEHVVTDAGTTYQFADQMPAFTLLITATEPGDRIWRSTFDLWALP